MVELKKCPFCGKEATVQKNSSGHKGKRKNFGTGGRAMKTPEDIKKALECCSDADGFDGDCIKCPYKGEQWCGDKSKIDALAYIQQLEAMQPKWISVGERLPEHVITPCLIYANGDIEMACWTHDKYGLAWWFFVDGEYETGVIHWMPLPEPPKDDA